MGLSLNVYLAFGVEVQRPSARLRDALRSLAGPVEASPIGDDRIVVFARESYVRLASGHVVDRDVIEVREYAHDHTEAWSRELSDALRSAGLRGTSAGTWLVVCDVR
jgi:hypothetical protein